MDNNPIKKIRIVAEISPPEHKIFKVYLNIMGEKPVKIVDWFKAEISKMRKEIAGEQDCDDSFEAWWEGLSKRYLSEDKKTLSRISWVRSRKAYEEKTK